jgi:hypothetical protein
MDIVRDASVKKKKRQKQTAMIVVAVIAVLGVTLGVSKLKPAPVSVEFGTVWPDTVKRGSISGRCTESERWCLFPRTFV